MEDLGIRPSIIKHTKENFRKTFMLLASVVSFVTWLPGHGKQEQKHGILPNEEAFAPEKNLRVKYKVTY